MRRLLAVCLMSLIGVAGCGESHGEGEASRPDEGWRFETDDPSVMSAQCGEVIEPDWFEVEPSPWYQPRSFGFSPNSALLLRSDAMMGSALAHRTVDGERFFSPMGAYTHALDRSWRLAARSQAYTRNVEVVERETGDVIATVQLGQEHSSVASAAFGPQAKTVSVVTCQQAATYVTSWSVADDAQVSRVQLEPHAPCSSWSEPSPQVKYTPDGRALVVVVPATGHLAFLDLETGEYRSVLAHEPHDSEEPMLPTEGVLDHAVHPGGGLVATSGAKGRVRLWTIPHLEPVGEEFAAGVAAVNVNTYAPPHRVSPLAWSPDGSVLAMMSESNEVVLRERSGRVVSTLAAPEPEQLVPESTTEGAINPPMEIAFDDTGRIGVGAYASIGMWSCGQAATEHAEGALDAQVELEGPEELRVGQRGIFHAHVDGAAAPVVMRLFIDGEEHAWPQTTASWNWSAHEPGTYSVRLEVDDGTASASREMTVEVLADTTQQD